MGHEREDFDDGDDDSGLDDDDDCDDDDDDQLHQARHVPDHLPLQHLKHHHVDDGARRDALQTTYNFLSLEDFFGTWNMETIIWESELDSSEIAIPIPMPIGLSGIKIRIQYRSPLDIHSRIQC